MSGVTGSVAPCPKFTEAQCSLYLIRCTCRILTVRTILILIVIAAVDIRPVPAPCCIPFFLSSGPDGQRSVLVGYLAQKLGLIYEQRVAGLF